MNTLDVKCVKLNVSFRIVLLRVIMKNDILQSIVAGAFLCTVKMH